MKNIYSVLRISMGMMIVLSSSFLTRAQISVTNTQTPGNLVQNVLLGSGVTASNITYNTSASSAQSVQGNVTYFTSNGTSFPISSGVLLTTGNGIGAIGPNDAGSYTDNSPPTPMVTSDPDLVAISSAGVTNGAILEFDFIPSGDTVSFRYMFGSDEYTEYSPSSYNDAFGFFLSGPGISGPYSNGAMNIATIPNTTTPVTINNVNNGLTNSGPCVNCAYFVYNGDGDGTGVAYGNAIQYDGTTVVLTAVAQVQCGQTYHIKLAICNVGDTGYDSGVFIEADSFASDAVDISVATVSGDTTVIEGCSDATFIFTRPATQVNDSMVVNYQIDGTAIMGTDYNSLPNPVIFVPGEDTIIITLNPIQDGINETPESVILTATTITECGDTIVTTGTLYIIDGPVLNINESDLNIACPNDSVVATATASGGYGPYTITWPSVSQTGTTAYLPAPANGTYNFIVNASDICGNTGTDTVTIVVNQTLKIDTMETQIASACQNDGVVVGVGSGFTGQPQYHWEGPGNNGSFQINASVMQNLPSGWYYFSITDNVCSVNDSIFLDQEPPPTASFTASATSGCSPLNVTFTNTSQNATDYQWSFGNGATLNTTDLNTPIPQTYSGNAIVQLIASKGPCSDTTQVSITISICGCTDPNGLNYNPLATVDDGSCLYPDPTVEVPNVFSPNGDGINDYFTLKTTYATSVEFTIVDRWGIKMFEGSGVNAAWNGEGANEGVYFYTYTVKGLLGKEITGQGFVELFRK